MATDTPAEMSNREKLIDMMDREFRVKAKKVGELLGVQSTTVWRWRSPTGPEISDKNLRLLRYELEHMYREIA